MRYAILAVVTFALWMLFWTCIYINTNEVNQISGILVMVCFGTIIVPMVLGIFGYDWDKNYQRS